MDSDSDHSSDPVSILSSSGGDYSSSSSDYSDHHDSDHDDSSMMMMPTNDGHHNLLVDSDSENSQEGEDPNFFEGVEKLLEVWFTRRDGKVKECDLRMIPREKVQHLLDICRCSIVGFERNDVIDSYVLSESSLFISKRRFILKTCGTTTPLMCLKMLLIMAKQYAGYDEVEDVFYSRKNYKRPELQKAPHRHFNQEVELLEKIFQHGSAYCLGSVNRDCWYLFTLDSPFSPISSRFMNPPHNPRGNFEGDQTLEILMTELDPSIMRIFSKAVCKSGQEATLKSGIDRIIPNAVINEHLFDPCGYSMNGIFKNGVDQGSNGSYMTIHITPEEAFSYVSFETNVTHCSYKDVINRVLDTFMPGKFVVTLFANKTSPAYSSHSEIDRLGRIKEWLRMESQFCRFKNYDLTYALYTKFPS